MILVIIFLVLGVKARINPHGPTVSNDFANCVIGLIDKNFAEPGLLYFINTNDVSTSVVTIRTAILKSVHDKVKYSVKIAKPTEKDKAICVNDQEILQISVLHMDHFEPIPLADYFVAIIDSYDDFTHLASRLRRSRSWNPKAMFIFVFFDMTSSDDHNIKQAENIINCLFKLNAINIVVIIPQANNIRRATVYGWRPYDPPKYCGYSNESARTRLFVENVCDHGIVKYTKTIFENKIPLDMKGCTLEMLALERQPFISRSPKDPNIEIMLIGEVAKRLNIKLNYKMLNAFRGEKQPGGRWDGALNDLVSQKGLILLGGIFPDNEVHEDFECSSNYLSDSYTWVVPRAFQQPLWLAFFIIFKRIVWISVVAGFVVVALTWMLLAKLSKDPTYRKNLDHYLINTWISNLGFVAYSRPVTNSLRLFFIFLNLYCVLLLTAYQTKLIDVLTNPNFEHQISTVEELAASDLGCGGSEELKDLFENSTDSMDMYFSDKWENIIDIKEAMINVVVHRNFSLLCSRLELAHITAVMPELSDKFGNTKFYAFEVNVFTVPLEMVSLRGFPFLNKFSKTLELFRQYGVNDKVRKYFAGYTLTKKALLLNDLEAENSSREALSTESLQGGFLALVFGYVFGTTIFVIEMTMNTKFVKNIKIFKKSVYTLI
ncbi:uncharacterized protein [Choristoneura fumiferana]|uniref:uncharacterized protein n=1 Tax=Choristoneura fumiferana TaxID=7141 RepID=UPI003D15EE48